MEKIEKDMMRITKKISEVCAGENSAAVIGANMNMIQTVMNMSDATMQRATAESLRGMANMMLQVIGKPKQ